MVILEEPVKVEREDSQPQRPLRLSDEATNAQPRRDQSSGSDADLAKKLSNPVADLISIPFQFNYDEGYGPKDAGILRLNIQPVIPFTLDEDWNLITRTIVPLIYQGSFAKGVDSEFGLGDILQSFFLSPKQPTNGWTWGIGPIFNWPTATDDQLGTGKWGAGPTAVLLKQEKGWTYGALVNHVWSFAGDSDRDEINATFLQPFLSYTFPKATTVGLSTEASYDWASDQWTVPIIPSISQLTRFGKLPVSLGIGGRWYAQSPDGGPEWGVRFTFTALLPK
ncbi:MAG: hypothetical protein IT445_18330 [Phycisphaeraceae bacterium]|nr:hypothetical protein [Phycisphaeraceae bacterium]